MKLIEKTKKFGELRIGEKFWYNSQKLRKVEPMKSIDGGIVLNVIRMNDEPSADHMDDDDDVKSYSRVDGVMLELEECKSITVVIPGLPNGKAKYKLMELARMVGIENTVEIPFKDVELSEQFDFNGIRHVKYSMQDDTQNCLELDRKIQSHVDNDSIVKVKR